MKAQWIEKQQISLRYFDTQTQGPVLVFLHGLGSSSIADFAEVIFDNRFAGYRSILIDLPGHGFSTASREFGYSLYDHASVLSVFLDTLGIKKIVCIGHSLGGTIAIALAQNRSDLITRLILLEPNLDPGIGTISKTITSQSEEAFITRGYAQLLSSLSTGGKNNPGDAVYHGTLSVASPLALYRSAAGLLHGTTPPQRHILASMNIPRFYIVSEQNINNIPSNELHALGLIPLMVAKSGHAMMTDNLEGVRDTLIQAIQY